MAWEGRGMRVQQQEQQQAHRSRREKVGRRREHSVPRQLEPRMRSQRRRTLRQELLVQVPESQLRYLVWQVVLTDGAPLPIPFRLGIGLTLTSIS
jgi:hypothetical protein